MSHNSMPSTDAPERVFLSRAPFVKHVFGAALAGFVALMAHVHGETGIALFCCAILIVIQMGHAYPLWPMVRPGRRVALMELDSHELRTAHGHTVLWRQVKKAEILLGGVGPVKHKQLVMQLWSDLAGKTKLVVDVHQVDGMTPEQVLVLVERRLAAVRAQA